MPDPMIYANGDYMTYTDPISKQLVVVPKADVYRNGADVNIVQPKTKTLVSTISNFFPLKR